MIRTPGTLVVRKIPSRNGPFAVADLVTDVAEFKVKDPLLDQFEPGEYKGQFYIAEIYLASYQSFGRSVTELRARLNDLRIDSHRAGHSDDAGSEELDPMDEVKPARVRSPHPQLNVPVKGKASTKPAPTKRKAAPDPGPTETAGPAGGKSDEDAELFGTEIHDLILSTQPVKLDPNIDDRARFRAQIKRLGQLGYDFKSQEQTWYPKA